MSLPTIASVVAQMSTLVDSWNVYTTQLRNWLAGTATGGPGSDGSYPLTDDQGDTFLVPSPAAQAARVDAVVDSAEAYSTSASSSAAAAATSAMNADTSEGKAATHRDDAQASATLAETYATAAGNSAASALASKTAAAASETAAATSASSMDQSVTDAQAAATSAEASASTATTQAGLASASATDAYASALTAQTYATGVLRYRGSWDASAGTFPPTPVAGDFWKIGVAGTVDGTDLSVGDQIIYSGSGWDKIDNTESVTSVAGRVGAVTLDLSDVAGLNDALAARVSSASAVINGTVDSRITFNIGGIRRGLLAVNPTTGVSSLATYASDGGSPLGQLDVGTGGLKYDLNAVWHAGNYPAADTAATANTAVVRDALGDAHVRRVYASDINLGAATWTGAISRVAMEQANDGYIRWQTPAVFLSSVGAVPAANLTGFTKMAVVTSLPGSPDANTLYFVK